MLATWAESVEDCLTILLETDAYVLTAFPLSDLSAPSNPSDLSLLISVTPLSGHDHQATHLAS